MVKKIVQSLEGEIHVDSEINQGTQVTVHFPLKSATTHEEPSEDKSHGYSKIPPNPVMMLRCECPDKTVSFFGFELLSTILLKDSVQFYITEWYHFSIIRDVRRADFVIVDETALDELLSKHAGTALPQRLVVLRSTTIRNKALPEAIHSILKPVGPYGLAKVLLNSWIRTPPSTPETEIPFLATSDRMLPASESNPRQMQLPMAHSQEAPQPTIIAVTPQLFDQATVTETALKTVKFGPTPSSISDAPPPIQVLSLVAPTTLEIRPSRKKEPTTSVQGVETEQLRILCVDDNPINLKVLQAYLKKLEKTDVKCVENGLEAFKAVESSVSSGTPFDLIFMGMRFFTLRSCLVG